MNSSVTGRCNGTDIFRNQAHYTHFNKTFEDPTDSLFLLLNEIDPIYLNEELLDKNPAFHSLTLLDPRTRQEVETTLHDHSMESTARLFQNGAKSRLTKAEHMACLRVLSAWQEEAAVEEKDVLVWRSTSKKRQIEKVQLEKIILKFEQAQKEKTYAPTKSLVEIYKRWYSLKIEMILKKQPQDIAYNTQAGLPHVRVCRDDGAQQVEIHDVKILRREGWLPLWQKDKVSLHCKRMKYKLKQLTELNRDAAEMRFTADDVPQPSDGSDDEAHALIIPLESILFLITSGDYIDLPTEMPLEIRVVSGHDGDEAVKRVSFERPLPARNCGWHTHLQVLEQLYDAHLTLDPETTWLQMHDDCVNVERPATTKEIVGTAATQCIYKPVKFDEYLENCQVVEKCVPRVVRTNAAFIHWRLTKSSDISSSPTAEYCMYTHLALPPALDETSKKLLGCHCIKLEYKPQFGCEVMTKYELLRAWWQLRLISGCVDAHSGECVRIAADTFAPQLQEHLTQERIEQQLRIHYHIEMPKLLANLMEFLRLLLSMPAGTYFLRYSPKFPDKLLLCAPTQEITQNTIFLHKLLQTEPTDLAFMTQLHVLPVADDLCSQRHLHHQVPPCMFPPPLKKRKQGFKPTVHAPKMVNDRQGILKRVRYVTEKRQQMLQNKEKKRKNAQKARRHKRKNCLKKQQKAQYTEEQALQLEIERDQFFFGTC